MATPPLRLIGSAIAPTSMSQPFGAYGPSTLQSAPAGTSSSSGLGFLGSGVLGLSSGSSGISGDMSDLTQAVSGVSLANKISNTTAGSPLLGTQGSAALGALGNIGGIYSGLQVQGGLGYAGAALSTAGLANNVTKLATGSPLFSGAAGSAISGAGDVLGIINGIKQGGLMGYGSAALNAYQLYNTASPIVSSLVSGGASSAGSTAGSAAGSVAGAGLASAGVGLAFAGAAYGLGALFNKQSQQSPAAMAAMNTNNAAGIAKLASETSNPTWAASLQSESEDMSALAAYENNPANATALMSGTATGPGMLPALQNPGGPSGESHLYIKQS